jgi:NAD(P)-dependent dehydrogenase (short-subunit alcohol dehydrogenase family)
MNKIALVTGGNRGLGKDIALSFARKGVDVLITYNTNKAEADKVVAEISGKGQKADALQFDISDMKSYDGFIQQITSTLRTRFHTEKFDYSE